MFSFVSEFLAMYDRGDVIVIDGCPYAPVEELAYSVSRAWVMHLASTAMVSLLVLVICCVAYWVIREFVLKK